MKWYDKARAKSIQKKRELQEDIEEPKKIKPKKAVASKKKSSK